MEKARLFVAGVPADTRTEEVAAYFGQIGKIDLVVTRLTSWNTKAFIICPSSPLTYREILLLGPSLEFKGRQLQVQPFATGTRLAVQVSRMNKRRVLARKVPGHLSADQFAAWLRKEAGEIETIYAFKADQAHLRNFDDTRRVKSYSILFKDKSSAQRILNIGEFSFNPEFDLSVFEKFVPRKKLSSSKNFRFPVNPELDPRQTTTSKNTESSKQQIHHHVKLGRVPVTNQELKARAQDLHTPRPTSTVYYDLRNHDWNESSVRFNRNRLPR